MSEPSPEELLSAEFDGLTYTEQTTRRSPQESEVFQQWRHLGDCLRAIPIEPTGRISTAVRSRVESSQAVVTRAGDAVPENTTRQRHRNVVAVLTTAVAIAIVAVPISDLLTQTDPMPVATMADAGVALPYNSAQAKSVLPANSRDWQVVVVTVSEQEHAVLSSKLRQSMGQSGLQIQSLSDASLNGDQTMGVLMSSADTSRDLLDALDSEFDDGVGGDIQTEWNPQQIGDFDRDELLARLTESMKTPTRSDIHFGEMFVVVPRNGTLVTEITPLNAGEHKDTDRSVDSLAAAATESPMRSRAGRTVSASPSDRSEHIGGHPVLVLFQKKPHPEGSQGQHQHRQGSEHVDELPLVG